MFDHHREDALTVISLSNDVPVAPERRENIRNLSVLKSAILRTSHGDELCLIRNISAGGVMMHVFSRLKYSDPVTIEFRSSHIVRGHVVWCRDDLAGVKFNKLINVPDILTDSSRLPDQTSRPPRITVGAPAKLRSGSQYQSVVLCNISQGGARIQLSEPDKVGEEAVLTVNGLPPIIGTVRWRTGDYAGVAFNTLIAFEDVARWASDFNRNNTPSPLA